MEVDFQMNDQRKFKTIIIATAALVALALSYNIFQEFFATGIEGYVQRRLHYEKVISKKGLTLHRGMYWKEKD